jgi:hypothetical protein
MLPSCLLLISFSLTVQSGAKAQSLQTAPTETPQSQADQRQQVHSAEIKVGYPEQISQELARTSGDVYLRTLRAPPLIVQVADSLGSLSNLSCENDLVVLGEVGNGTSHATLSQSYIYTDWELTIKEVLRNDARSPAQVGQTIVVTRQGGTLTIRGRHVYTHDDDFKQFQSGAEVLLYLHYLPGTGTYSLRQPNGFAFSGSEIMNLGKLGYIQSGMMQRGELLRLARKAATEKCPTQGRQ